MDEDDSAFRGELRVELLRNTIVHLSSVIADSEAILFRAKVHLEQAKALVDELEGAFFPRTACEIQNRIKKANKRSAPPFCCSATVMGKRSATSDISPSAKRSKEADSGALPTEEKSKAAALLEELRMPVVAFTSSKDYERHFVEHLAPLLLQRVVFCIGDSRYRIREVEFYFTDDRHDDPFTHCSSIQESTGVWYFHRQGSGYKGGTYKGLDVAIGQGSHAPGGVLIRSIEDLESGELVCGPCKCVDRILSALDSSSIASLVEDVLENDIAVDGGKTKQLYLELSQELPFQEVMFSGRVGLHLTKKVPIEEQCDFVFRQYRAFTNGKQIPKGRQLMVLAQHMEGKTTAEIIATVGGTKAAVPKWTALCDKGTEHGNVKPFASKRLSSLQICECYGAVHSFLQRMSAEE